MKRGGEALRRRPSRTRARGSVPEVARAPPAVRPGRQAGPAARGADGAEAAAGLFGRCLGVVGLGFPLPLRELFDLR